MTSQENQPTISQSPEAAVQPGEKKASQTTALVPDKLNQRRGLVRYRYLLLIMSVLIVIGSLTYFWYGNQKLLPKKWQGLKTIPKITSPTPTPIKEKTKIAEKLEIQSDSDEISEIESDLSSTDLSQIDLEIKQINQELAQP